MKYSRWLEIAALLTILALAAYLRLTNVADNPGWYTDEAAHIDIAHHLLNGEIRYLAITQSTLLFARPPLFHLLLTGWFHLFGVDISSLRLLTGLLGTVAVGLLYGIARRLSGDQWLALLAALLLAIYPQAVLYSRFGFSYNLLPTLLLLATLGLGEYVKGGECKWLALASLMIGLGVISDLAALTFIPVLIVVVAVRRWRDALWSLPLVVLPFSVYTIWMLLQSPDAFLFDLGFTFGRLNTLTPLGQLKNLGLNYTTLLSQDFWILAGIIGLFWLRPLRLKYDVLAMFWIPLILMGRTVALYSLSAYYLIPLMPFVALGAAGLLRWGIPHLYRMLRDDTITILNRPIPRWAARVGAALCILALVGTPLAISLKLTIKQVQTQFGTAIDPFLVNAADARAVAAYLNAQTQTDDVVIASPAVGWQFTAQTADFQMVVAAAGEDAPHLPGNIPPEHWAFDPRFENAQWLVVDNLWRNWGAVHIPGVARMLQTVQQNWTLVFEAGAIQIYRRPSVP